ncbi:peptide ABC transporter permease [Mesotoga sp. HF07.pep.5.2.highcov]|uniref:ABC-type dipeptide/oligopeptide/nickel transport system, permease component n=1 Tax=Mesotoga prima MesG1.Ag.4.2 TaxID=660470 RepID=I2F7Z8_9BACT|nr:MULTISPECIES: ABC transporter permease [Mesotoga]AFK08051.1 ABC-type dipeptide/oligopeptide/nickel transport system, permease component [Mesotoga prima MesG1.Ag.4.2]PIJ62799.1 peptide ABC transporter permease [Mesotoga sp. H07.pep.5.3]RLL91859.1 peptide ABC transporter permease [Mesotoga sp. HF07.pep.5.2.highcov]CCU85099.1 putative D,D-dipeptide transport system permease protein ddpB [Mesotoga infera]
MNFGQFLLRRLFLMIIVLFGVACIVFFIANVIPADPVGAILGGNAPPEAVDRLKAKLGYDQPLIIRFGNFITGAVRGDFGISLKTSNPVMEDIRNYFPATMELALVAITISIILGITLGILSAVHRNKAIDQFSRIFSILGVSMPVFWIGLLLLLVFYFKLGWLPGSGRLGFFTYPPPRVTGMYLIDSIIAGQWDTFKEALMHILLPAFVLGYNATASIARITRASMLDVLRQDFIRTAKSKGLRKNVVIYRHALRNSLIPTVTIIGLVFGSLLEGAVLTETVFSWPGLGRYITTGMLFLDYPAVMGGTLYIALIYSIANLIVDILYALLDPRMRM